MFRCQAALSRSPSDSAASSHAPSYAAPDAAVGAGAPANPSPVPPRSRPETLQARRRRPAGSPSRPKRRATRRGRCPCRVPGNRIGGWSPSPIWTMRWSPGTPSSRNHPRSCRSLRPRRPAVAPDARICPPCPAAEIRAATHAAAPTYPVATSSDSPVCRPIRTPGSTPSGQRSLAAARCARAARAAPSSARWKATPNDWAPAAKTWPPWRSRTSPSSCRPPRGRADDQAVAHVVLPHEAVTSRPRTAAPVPAARLPSALTTAAARAPSSSSRRVS